MPWPPRANRRAGPGRRAGRTRLDADRQRFRMAQHRPDAVRRQVRTSRDHDDPGTCGGSDARRDRDRDRGGDRAIRLAASPNCAGRIPVELPGRCCAMVTSASPAITGISKDGVMTYRTIVVELQADRFPAARLTAARALARRFGASLVGLHVMPPPFVPALWEGGGAVYLGPEIIATQTKAIQETKQRVKALFEEICGADPAVTWREDEGEPGRRVAEVARSADLVITTSAQAASDATPDLAEALLTTCRRAGVGAAAELCGRWRAYSSRRLGRLARGHPCSSCRAALPPGGPDSCPVRHWGAGRRGSGRRGPHAAAPWRAGGAGARGRLGQ